MFCKLNDVTKCKAGLTESSMFIKNYSEEHQYCEMFSNQKHISMAVTGLEILIYKHQYCEMFSNQKLQLVLQIISIRILV